MQVTLEHSPNPELLGRFRTHIEATHPFAETFVDFDKFAYISVMDGEYLAALVWLAWVPGADRVLEIHASARPEFHGRWLSKEVVRCLFNAEHVLHPRVLLAQVFHPKIERIWRRLGFEIIGPFAVSVREKDDGRVQEPSGAESCDATGDTPDQGSSGPE